MVAGANRRWSALIVSSEHVLLFQDLFGKAELLIWYHELKPREVVILAEELDDLFNVVYRSKCTPSTGST